MSYAEISDLEDAIGAPALLRIYNDLGKGVRNDRAVQAILERASAQVDSRLPRGYISKLPFAESPVPALLKSACIDYAIAYTFERSPEYARTFGENARLSFWNRADKTMENIATAVQYISDSTQEPVAKTTGGTVVNPSPRIFSEGDDGFYIGDFL